MLILLLIDRCNVKDVAVEVPVPDNTIPDLIIPSHIVVPRCTGKLHNTIPDVNIPLHIVIPKSTGSFHRQHYSRSQYSLVYRYSNTYR
jgi:hypothetical protein